MNIQIDPVLVANRPDLYEYTVTLDSAFTGLFLNVKVQASNAIGITVSPSNGFVLADVPAKPSPAPTVNPAWTSTTQIAVDFANQNTDNGGSPVTVMQLLMDDGH